MPSSSELRQRKRLYACACACACAVEHHFSKRTMPNSSRSLAFCSSPRVWFGLVCLSLSMFSRARTRLPTDAAEQMRCAPSSQPLDSSSFLSPARFPSNPPSHVPHFSRFRPSPRHSSAESVSPRAPPAPPVHHQFAALYCSTQVFSFGQCWYGARSDPALFARRLELYPCPINHRSG